VPSASRPNLLLFMTDQQRADSLGCFGNPVARTPNVDALAGRGVRFADAFSQHSACSQSRISMMTGWYPHVAGHRTLDNLLKPWEPNVLATLRSAGYHVAWAGIRGDTFAPGGTEAATDFFGYLVRPSLDTVAASHAEAFPEGHRLRHTHYLGCVDGGVDFDEAAVLTAIDLLQRGLPEPFVLVLTLFAPHPPFAVAEPWFSMHDRADMPATLPSGRGKPRFMAAVRERSGLDALTPDDWAEISATYAGMVSRADDQLGRVLGALDGAGAGERTVTCFFTDHGEYLGDYGLVEKWPSGLDGCLVRNPLVIAGPGVREGAVHDGPVEMVDLLPTLCELADLEPEHVQFGRSLVPLLTGATSAHRDAAFSEGGFRVDEADQNELPAGHPYDVKTSLLREEPELVGRAVAVRTSEWTYVHRTCERDELYDRRADPGELDNVVDAPEHAPAVAALRGRILDWLVETSDVIPRDRDPRMEPALVDQFLAGG
jgi:arylsulfatase A-like enzyme